MLLQDYTHEAVKNETKSLKNQARGTDGMPAESYKAIQTWVTEPLTHMINEIKDG